MLVGGEIERRSGGVEVRRGGGGCVCVCVCVCVREREEGVS